MARATRLLGTRILNRIVFFVASCVSKIKQPKVVVHRKTDENDMANMMMTHMMRLDACYVLDDDDTGDAMVTCLAASLLSLRAFGKPETVYVIGTQERHRIALDAAPPLGIRSLLFDRSVFIEARVEAVRRCQSEGVFLLIIPSCKTVLMRDPRPFIYHTKGTGTVVDVGAFSKILGNTSSAPVTMMLSQLLEIQSAAQPPPPPSRAFDYSYTAADEAADIVRTGEVGVHPHQEAGADPRLFMSPPPATTAVAVRYCVILLRGRPERETMVERLRARLPNLTVIDAVDGSCMGEKELRELQEVGFLPSSPPYEDAFIPGRKLTVNNVAAFLSHRRAIEAAAAAYKASAPTDEQAWVVFEDDVALRPSFHWVMDGVLRAVRSRRIDLVHLYVMPGNRACFRRARNPMYTLAPTPRGLWGMQAYMITCREAAETLSAGLWPMRGAVDEQFTRVPDLQSYTLNGPPILDEDCEAAPSVTNAGRPRLVCDLLALHP